VKTHVLVLLGVMSTVALPAAAQEPPATPPPVMPPASAPAPAAGADPAAPVALSAEDLRRRRNAIFLMEGMLINAVKLGARNTAEEIQRVQPGLMMFSSAPVKAHGAYLEGYGVFFWVEIPSVIPSVASLVETLGRDAMNRERMGQPNLAEPTSISTSSAAAMINPDAHYVESVKAELISAMVQYSYSMDLRPGERLTVSARDASEMPGQVAPPSTVTLTVKASDLVEFAAGRITQDEIRRRVTTRGF
jgi:hypothetical protein